MSNWQSGIFTDVDALKSDALYTAKFIKAEETEFDSVKKVRFIYSVVDANGEQHNLNRSFIIDDKNQIRRWLQSHTSFDSCDSEMREMKDAKHLVKIAYFKDNPFIQNVFPLDGDLCVYA